MSEDSTRPPGLADSRPAKPRWMPPDPDAPPQRPAILTSTLRGSQAGPEPADEIPDPDLAEETRLAAEIAEVDWVPDEQWPVAVGKRLDQLERLERVDRLMAGGGTGEAYDGALELIRAARRGLRGEIAQLLLDLHQGQEP